VSFHRIGSRRPPPVVEHLHLWAWCDFSGHYECPCGDFTDTPPDLAWAGQVATVQTEVSVLTDMGRLAEAALQRDARRWWANELGRQAA
jgi:hypothetical protein